MTRDEAFKCCLEYFGGDTLAANVAVDKYLLNEDGNYLEKDLKDVFNRNIKELLRADEKYGDNRLNRESLEDIFYNKYAILQGSPLYGLGNNFARTTLSNCYVVESPIDSMSGIMNSAKELANLFKSRGGCGINLSSLRPEGAKVSNSAKVSTGAWSFASLFSDVTKAVGQCIAEDQTVLTRRGAKAIKDVAVGDLVWTKEGWISVVAVHKNGPKEVYKIKDKNGFSVETTLNHKFVTLNESNKMEEIEVGELKEGDKIILIPGTFDREARKAGVELTSTDYLIELKTSTGYKNYIKENINAAFAIGCLLGFSHMRQIKLSEDGFFEMFFKPRRHYLVPTISAFLKKNFDIDVVVYQNDNKKFIRIDDPNFIAFLKELNFIDGCDGEVRQPVIPEVFKHAKFKIQIAFISGFSSMQRVFYPEGIQKTVYIFPNYKFATDYMQILMSFGIVFTGLRFVNGFWTLTLPQGSMVKKFTKMFSLIEIKNKVIVEQLRKANEENTIRKSQEHELVITPFKIGKSHISVGLFERMGDKAPCKAPVVVSKLSSIEYVDIKETYDLELESEHLFYCNGFYVHNSGRRGALMEALHIQHPDSPKFITCKMDKKAVTSANISVMLSDEFMQAVESGEKFNHKWPVGSDKPKFTSVSDARDLWGSFVRSNIASAEPGALFWDRMASYTPNASYDRFKPICVNPCAEVGMAANSNCRLMSINLLPFVNNPYTELASFDFNKFADVVSKSVYILDNLVDLDLEKMKELADTDEKDVKELWYKFIDQTLNGREIGLGTHGFGDCLAALGRVYGSESSKEMTRAIYGDLCKYSYEASKELAITRGAFLAYNEGAEKDNKFFEGRDWLRGPRRNISLLTSAPTGSISILHQVTSGIEPVFKRSYTRRRKVNKDQSTFTSADGQHFEENTVYHHSIVKCKEVLGEASKEYIEKYFVESHDIDPLKKVELLAIIQENVDHSLSSCVPEDTYVSTDRGFRRIGDLVPKDQGVGFVDLKEPINVFTHTGKLETIYQGYYNGYAKTKEINFLKNDRFVGTEEHKLMVLNEDYSVSWRELKNIKVGDWVLSSFGTSMFHTTENGKVDIQKELGEFINVIAGGNTHDVKLPKYLTKKLSRLLGYLVSDGWIDKNGFGLSQTKNNVIDDFEELVWDLFGMKCYKYLDKRTKDLYRVSVSSRILRDYLLYLGLTRDCETKTIPKIIMERGGREHIIEFLNGITLDGHVSANSVFVMTTISKKLAFQISYLLKQIGIDCNISDRKPSERVFPCGKIYKTKPAYVIMCGGIDAFKFVELIGFAEERKIKEFKNNSRGLKKSRKTLYGNVPDFGLRAKLRKEFLPTVNSTKMYNFVHSMTDKDKRNIMSIERESLIELCDLGAKKFIPEILLDRGLIFKQVQSVQDGEIVETFDLSVPIDHSYIANNFITHNTTNLPKGVPFEVVSDIYMLAWKLGLKGLTIYVEGSREGILVSEPEEKLNSKGIKERPDRLKCDIHHTTIKGEKWIVCVGLLDDKPYEVFCGLQSCLEVNNKFKHGSLIRKPNKKEERSIYDLVLLSGEDEIVIPDIVKTFKNKEHMVLGRMISLSLRQGGKLAFIAEQLLKDSDSDFLSYNKVLSRILKKYIVDGEKPESGSCPECGGTMVYQGGCPICNSCGFSKCG